MSVSIYGAYGRAARQLLILCGLGAAAALGNAWADEPAATSAPPPAAAPADPKLAAKGEDIFRHTCSHCHGFHMMNPGPGVFDLRTFPHDDKARFVHSVTNGKNAMPSWKEKLQPDDIEALWAYVSSAPPPQ